MNTSDVMMLKIEALTARIDALTAQIEAMESYDIDALIAEGMTGVTLHNDARIDALTARIEAMESAL